MALISSVLATCKFDSNGTSSDSDTSSIEILKALTSHMTSTSPMNLTESSPNRLQDPTLSFFDKMATVRSEIPVSTTDDVNNTQAMHADYLDRLISNEENYYAFILLKCFKLCPSVFGELF